jgi:hypothetical protein
VDRVYDFTAIAASTCLARATLYRNPQIRAVIDEHRARQAEARTLSGLAAEITHLRSALEAVAGNVRHHEERSADQNGKQKATITSHQAEQ